MSITALSKAEAAQRLGISIRTLTRMIKAQELVAFKVRSQTRVLETDLNRYIAAQRRAAAAVESHTPR